MTRRPLDQRLIWPTEIVHLPIAGDLYLRLRHRARRLRLTLPELLERVASQATKRTPKSKRLTGPLKTKAK